METEFTPFLSLLGGSLIGLAAVLLMLTHGRIAGATGILTGALTSKNARERNWRIAALAGMVSAPPLSYLATGAMPTIDIPASTPMLLGGGFVVGIGVTLARGCTSGHGVCGLARLSPRSFVATLTFMLATGLTVYVIRHITAG